MADHFCDMFLIKKIYLPTLRPIIADSYWAINSLFSTSFAIITDETQIFHPPWYFPCSWFLDWGHFIQWKIIGGKSAGTNRSNFSSLDEIYHENVTKFQLSPLSLFLEGRKGNLPHFTLKIFWRGPTFWYQYRHLIHYGIFKRENYWLRRGNWNGTILTAAVEKETKLK